MEVSLPAAGMGVSVPPASMEKENKSGAASFVSGAVAGMASTTLLQPLDVVKTHLQASVASKGNRLGISDVVRTVVRKEGLAGLWRGTGPSCLRVGLGAGLYFAVLGPIVRALAGDPTSSVKEKLPASVAFGAGAMTRALASFAVCPITVVKTRMEYAAASGLRYTSTAAAIASIARNEGPAGLYSGMLATLARDAPYSGLYLLFYNRLQHALRDVVPEGREVLINFSSGAIAGASSTLLTHPPDVIRTRLQLNPEHHTGILSVMRGIVQAQGFRGLYSGILPRVGRRALQQAFSWTIFEELSSWIQKRF